MIPAAEALSRLREGNSRFTKNLRSSERFVTNARRAELANSQEPFAIILGCSDSRVPAEIVFDQGLGDLFVIRVAGNIVAKRRVRGSAILYAARRRAGTFRMRRDPRDPRRAAGREQEPVAQPQLNRRPRSPFSRSPARDHAS